MTVRRPRPRAMTEVELGFRPQGAVRWLAPKVLASTGIQSVIATIFGSYADKRELQGVLEPVVHRHGDDELRDGELQDSESQDGELQDGELWFDYVADVGDGFDATYSVASLLAAESVDVPGHGRLPRGRLLVMGGDEVYPGASTRAYEDRTKGVYRAALPAARGPRPALYALPGNHDWYDGLTSFLRVFAQRRPIGGWDTRQTRSYFAIELPHRWWLFAVDTQFDDYVDAPQLEYFREASAGLRPGDGVILCTPNPAWVDAGSGRDAKGHDTLEFFDREIVRARGARIRVMLSGDQHHYARYAERDGDAQRITCGLGGAYLAATHELPESLCLPPQDSRVRGRADPTHHDLAAAYPDRAASRRFATGIFRLPWRNPGFWRMTGVLQTLMTLAVLYGMVGTLGSESRGFFGKVASWAPSIGMGVVLLLGALAFARLQHVRQGLRATAAGVLHACAHLALTVGWALTVSWLHTDVLPDGWIDDWATLAVVLLGTPLVIGFLDAELVACYLLVASRLGINVNEVMAGQSIEDHKGFLRLRIDRAGDLTIHPLRLDRICRSWLPNPGGAEHEPWLLPGEPLRVAPIEPPITVTRVSAAADPAHPLG